MSSTFNIFLWKVIFNIKKIVPPRIHQAARSKTIYLLFAGAAGAGAGAVPFICSRSFLALDAWPW